MDIKKSAPILFFPRACDFYYMFCNFAEHEALRDTYIAFEQKYLYFFATVTILESLLLVHWLNSFVYCQIFQKVKHLTILINVCFTLFSITSIRNVVIITQRKLKDNIYYEKEKRNITLKIIPIKLRGDGNPSLLSSRIMERKGRSRWWDVYYKLPS